MIAATAIFPPVCFLRRFGRFLFACLFLLPVQQGYAQSVSLDLGTLVIGTLRAERVQVAFSQGGSAWLTVASVRYGDRALHAVRIDCPGASFGRGKFICADGRLSAREVKSMAVDIDVDPQRGRASVTLRPGRNERWQIEASRSTRGATAIDLSLVAANVERLVPWLPQLAQENWHGRVSGSVHAIMGKGGAGLPQTLRARLHAEQLAFSRANGTQAVSGFNGVLTLDGDDEGERWDWRAGFEWSSGEVYVQPVYLAGGGWSASASGALQGDLVSVSQAYVKGDGIGEARFAAQWSRSQQALLDARIDTDELDLSRVGSTLLAPLLEQRGVSGLALNGRAQASLVLDRQGLQAVDLTLDSAGVSDAAQRFRVDGVSGRIPWRRDSLTAAHLHFGGAMLGRLPLGEFDVDVAMHGYDWRIPTARIPILDAALHVRDLAVQHVGDAWTWQAGADLEPLSMPRLTALFGLPSMAGSLGASLPRVSYAGGVLNMDGALLIQVFDGYLRADALQVIEPWGRLPRLTADVEARHIDLGQLTETFRFGRITGFIDASMKGLELANWAPLAFDARIDSSPGSYEKRISQRAVEDITALGGAGATLAIQRSFLRFFDRFGYSAIGWRCVLRDGVCHMDGLAPTAGDGYLIVRGGGIPALNVIGYNRRVDWAELVSRLKRVTAEGSTPVIR